MSKPRKKPSARKGPRGRTYTISCTDEQWAAIQDGAERAGEKVSPWFVKCALTVEPWPRKHRRLVLNEREQRRHARAVAASARNLGADEAGRAGDVGADLRALMGRAAARDGAARPARERAGAAAPGVRRRGGANRGRGVDARGDAGAVAVAGPVPYRRRLGGALACCMATFARVGSRRAVRGVVAAFDREATGSPASPPNTAGERTSESSLAWSDPAAGAHAAAGRAPALPQRWSRS